MRLSKHHRKCTSWNVGKKATREDVSYVLKQQHFALHTLFSNLKPNTIANIINDKWIDSDYIFICERRRK